MPANVMKNWNLPSASKSFSDAFSEPFIRGIASAQQLMQAQKAQKELPYVERQIEQDMMLKKLVGEEMQLTNQKLTAEQPYWGQMAQELAQKGKLENMGVEAELPWISKIKEAMFNNINQENQYYPLQFENDAQKLALEKLKYELSLRSQEYKESHPSTASLGNMGVGLRDIMGLKEQIKIEHPNWNDKQINDAANAYLDENVDAMIGDEKLGSAKGAIAALVSQIGKRNSTVALQNKAANASMLADDVNDIDIKPIAQFAGPKGQAKAAIYEKMDALGQSVPDEYRQYKAFKNILSYYTMDQLRATFGTSVIPDYVQKTLGGGADPISSSIWKSPDQAIYEWNEVKKYVNRHNEKIRNLANKGATWKSDEEENNTIMYDPSKGWE
jgi:hypothetical protein